MYRPDNEFLSRFNATDRVLINQALQFTATFKDQKTTRPKGIEVAAILLKLNVDIETLLAALLSDPLLRDQLDNNNFKDQFGSVVASLVKDVNWLNTLNVYTQEMVNQPNQAESLRRMLLSMTGDVRAVLIKLAYRVQRLKNLENEDSNMRNFVARETLDIYAPIASRLGIGQLKWELEDRAFNFLDPHAYKAIVKSLAEDRTEREHSIKDFTRLLQDTLTNENLTADIYGRPKHIYSIWKKMLRKRLGIEELYDLLAIRIIVNDLASCYSVLGMVHSHWQYIPKEFDDYIANPKKNGYQSLHTVVIDAQGNRLEIQIRTTEMNEFAELGIAAHWRYKEAGKQNSIADESIASLRQSLAEKDSNEALLEDFRTELFADRVFTLTPDGKLIDLIKGATPLDFAYAVHTEVGHRCRGAKVNHHIVPLTYTLQSGDRVEILTTNVGAPNHNWIDPNLDYLKTSRAIHKVKAWFRKQQQEQNVTAGKNILSVEVHRLGLTTPDQDEIATHFKFSSQENFLAAIGRGDVTTRQLSGFLQIPEEKPEVHEFVSKHKPSNKHSTVIVQGVDNVLTSFAQCCNPVHGDEIIAFISHTKGITIHRRACINLTQLSAKQQTRLLRANWGAPETLLTVPIVIQANDRQGLINDVTRILDQAKINILDALYQRRDDFSALLELTIQINSTDQLSQILGKINQIPDILDARRKLNN